MRAILTMGNDAVSDGGSWLTMLVASSQTLAKGSGFIAIALIIQSSSKKSTSRDPCRPFGQ